MRTSRSVIRRLARYVVWQMPEMPYPSSHPTALRSNPLDVRA